MNALTGAFCPAIGILPAFRHSALYAADWVVADIEQKELQG